MNLPGLMMRAFLKKLLTGFSKVIGQKLDKQIEMGALLTRTEVKNAENRNNDFVYGIQQLIL